jgi:hypothetical protein
VVVESKLCPLGTSAINWPIVLAPSDCEDGEFGGMNGRGNRSTRRKPAPTPLCPPQIPLDQTQDWTRAAAVGSQRLTASAMARPYVHKLQQATVAHRHVEIPETSLCGICGAQSGIWRSFLRVLQFLLSILIPRTAPKSLPTLYSC